MINIKNLQKTFGKNEVLKGIDLEIEAGEVVVIIGPSGSGKSTFLRCLNLLETPTGGSVEFEGKNLLDKNTNIDQLRQKMGMVFQNFNLFPHKNVLENLTISPVKVKKEAAAEATEHALSLLEQVGLSDKKENYPAQLSGGQQQRLCIARALAVQPEVILLDEPTSALDPISTLKIEELLLQLKDQYTIAIVTHNMQQASRIADYTAFFLVGEMVEYGPTKDVFGMPKDKRTEDYITGRFG